MMRSEQPGAHGSSGVLIVEDEGDQAAILQVALQAQGVLCSTVSTCRQARMALEACPWAVVVIDAHLPDGSATDLIRLALGNAARPDVLCISGLDDPALALHALQQGASDFIPKPLDIQDLCQSIMRRLSARAGPPRPPVQVQEDLP